MSRGASHSDAAKIFFPQLLGLGTRSIPSSKGEQVRTLGSTNRHTHSALMAYPTPRLAFEGQIYHKG